MRSCTSSAMSWKSQAICLESPWSVHWDNSLAASKWPYAPLELPFCLGHVIFEQRFSIHLKHELNLHEWYLHDKQSGTVFSFQRPWCQK